MKDVVVVKGDVQFDFFSNLQITISSSDLSACNSAICKELQKPVKVVSRISTSISKAFASCTSVM